MNNNRVIAEFLGVKYGNDMCMCAEYDGRMHSHNPTPNYANDSGMFKMLRGLDEKEELLYNFTMWLGRECEGLGQKHVSGLEVFVRLIFDPTLCRDKVAEWIMERKG